jgi:DNA-binding transcriptional MerR regulator
MTDPSQEEPILRKAYYAMGEVCDLTGLKPHVLRYWETQFEALRPTKNRAGNRVYRPREVELILLVKNLLYERKFTIEGARQKLRELRQDGELAEERHEVAIPELVEAVKEELFRLRSLLTLPETEEASGSGGGPPGNPASPESRSTGGGARPGSGAGPAPGSGGARPVAGGEGNGGPGGHASPRGGGGEADSQDGRTAGGPGRPGSGPPGDGAPSPEGGDDPWPQLHLDVDSS